MFQGSYVALITPFRNGQIDEEALRGLVSWHVEEGTHGIVVMGTTGESATVSHKEHKRVVSIVVEEAAKRIPVIAGAGSNNPVEALEHAQHAEKVGADGVLCVAGYYNRPSQEGLYQHFKYLHDATKNPMIIYNIPPRAIVDILPETMARLANLPRVIGVKDATKDLSRISLERQLVTKSFCYFSGEDMTPVAYNAQGGNGCISVTANVAPRLHAEMQTACLEGDFKKALEIHEKLTPLHLALSQDPSPSGVKYAASLMGLCREEVRLPILSPNESVKENIQEVLKAYSLI